ncbi:glycerophosphoryl diester phosphodiesterase [Spirochaetia bacterium]|nr:glycerophosphoryl diester phosphodiesterase [Spirochaetia bacterium]
MKKIPLLPDRKRPLLFAHRGCSSLAPENTMAAFKKAREIGAPGIELDIHVCATGELVVAHDHSFNRTARTDNKGSGREIEDLSLDEIRSIDVGGEHPPLLEEVLEEFCPGMYIDIELKSRKVFNDPLPSLAAKKIISFGKKILESVTVSSFNPFGIKTFKGFCPTVPTAIIWSAGKDIPFLLRRGFGRVISSCDYLKPVHLQASRFRPFPRVPWTVDDPALAKELLAMGCEGIISNRPQDMLSL